METSGGVYVLATESPLSNSDPQRFKISRSWQMTTGKKIEFIIQISIAGYQTRLSSIVLVTLDIHCTLLTKILTKLKNPIARPETFSFATET